ncbi:putative integral membrane protein [Rubidibacter lacunae KORDI 51-2]|uniref:Putative integral membrane protein n=1 Tax=Rubidibacter lacunae KORDI 51-2 TaxID=582515 RepID=U5DT33_9CHRO|nr:TMEM175 family protein [Rubidibacter lacunae]ERN42845.1 putative integral membrane protein [Rubidibacter lacunae KORDI 51-2]
MNRERLGALIDAVYAIAMTILVLELPLPDTEKQIYQDAKQIVATIIDYGLTFLVLFGFWYNQRRISALVEVHSRLTLWLNGLALMVVCLLPFSARLLFKSGYQETSLLSLNYSTGIDIIFIVVCLLTDLLLHLTLIAYREHQIVLPKDRWGLRKLKRSRRIATVITASVMVVVVLVPGPDRRMLVLIPLLLMFEDEVIRLVEKGLNNVRKS